MRSSSRIFPLLIGLLAHLSFASASEARYRACIYKLNASGTPVLQACYWGDDICGVCNNYDCSIPVEGDLDFFITCYQVQAPPTPQGPTLADVEVFVEAAQQETLLETLGESAPGFFLGQFNRVIQGEARELAAYRIPSESIGTVLEVLSLSGQFFTLSDTKLNVSIEQPTPATIPAGEIVVLRAQASDEYGRDLADFLQWTSSLDGDLGTGRTLVTAELSPGSHVIIAKLVSEDYTPVSTFLNLDVEGAGE